MLQQQGSMIPFIEAFRLLGFIFVIVVPLIFLMRRPRHVSDGMPAH